MCIDSVLCCCLLLMLLTPAGGIDRHVTCDAGTYAPGQSAFITCNLYDGVQTQKLDVTLVRYPFNATKNNPGKDIMTCRWQEGEKKHWCNTKVQGYELVDKVDMERPTVKIPSVSDEFAGVYMCSIIPPDGTRSHSCPLTIREGRKGHTQLTQDTDSNRAGNHNLLWIIVLPVIVAVGLGGLVFFLWRKNQSLRKQIQQEHVNLSQEHVKLIQPAKPSHDGSTTDKMIRPEAPNVQVRDALQRFVLTTSHSDVLMEHLQKEMRPKPDDKTTIQMVHTCIGSLPTGQEQGDILVIDFGSTVLKIEHIKLHKPNMNMVTERYPFPSEVKKGTGKKLIDFIAEHVDAFAGKNDLLNKDMPMALVFPFPCEQGSDLSKATLTKWTKGFECNDILGEDLGKLLQSALHAKNRELKFKIKVIANDSVGTLVSVAVNDPTCRIALILGNGFNGCYFEQPVSASTNSARTNMVIVNTEWGALGEDGCLNMIRTPVDIELDTESANPGQQTLEKMVSRMYIGEIVRLVLLKLISEDLLFKSNNTARAALTNGSQFRADFVSLIESDTSNHYLNTKFVLRLLEVDNYKEDDCKTVRYVCQIVSERAANLASAALATLINLTGRPDADITVAVDGSVYQYHPHFHDLIHAKTRDLVKTDLRERFKMVSSKNGSVRGAALLAATSS